MPMLINHILPASTQRCFNVVTTLLTLKQRCYNVKTTSCDCWAFNTVIIALFSQFVPNVDVVDFLHYWTTQPGFPIVKASISETQTQMLSVQSRFDYQNSKKWSEFKIILL